MSTWEKTRCYCPACGKRSVWRDANPLGADYYDGEDYRCVECGASMCHPDDDETVKPEARDYARAQVGEDVIAASEADSMTNHLAALDAAYNRLIELWHESDSEQRAHEFMGITEDEYAAWAERSGMWAAPLAMPSESVSGSSPAKACVFAFRDRTCDEVASDGGLPHLRRAILSVDLAVGPETTCFEQRMLPEDALSLNVVALCASCATERGQVTVGQHGPFVSWSFVTTGPCACGASSVRFEARPPT